ncbi:hypothetical protein H9L39_08076 [Fusarium oxysporum f. sp. albedinis]|nr:hypothetical protein H9L39_08076 [Fusarium oxysporum f. sp. albedinis]
MYHLERGSCPKAAGLNRDTLYKFVRSKDPGGSITNNLIGWHGSSHYEANHLANYQHFQVWECYLCHRLFGSLNGLNQHLNSPVYLDRSGEVLSLSKTRLQEEVHDLDCYYQSSRRRGLRLYTVWEHATGYPEYD